jgi:hypothetical protein
MLPIAIVVTFPGTAAVSAARRARRPRSVLSRLPQFIAGVKASPVALQGGKNNENRAFCDGMVFVGHIKYRYINSLHRKFVT